MDARRWFRDGLWPGVGRGPGRYLEYYGRLREAGVPDQDLFEAMLNRYPEWVSRQQFLILGL